MIDGMPNLTLMNAKGTKDFAQEEALLRDRIKTILKETFELYGFAPLETPPLERYDILSSKYAGGAEILKETFKVIDQGKRELALRYDLTVPLCRFVGMNPRMKMPFKRYQVASVFRDGPVANDRLRTFTQADVDIVGTTSMAADAQCLQIASTVFKKLDISASIEINNRKFLDGLFDDLGLKKDKWVDAILVLDKMKKMSKKDLEKEFMDIGLNVKQVRRLFTLMDAKGSNKEKIAALQKKLKSPLALAGLAELKELFTLLPRTKQTQFTPTLARGLAYYTGTVFEVFATKGAVTSSITSGGRYDNMIGDFLGSKEKYPAVGISFGIERLALLIADTKLIRRKTPTQVFVLPIGTDNACVSIIQQFREAGINTDTDILNRNVSKNLKYVNSLGIPYVLFVGEEEVKKKKYKLKDMTTGKEFVGSMHQIVKRLEHI
jgi:histidyl-tRNA synthetase